MFICFAVAIFSAGSAIAATYYIDPASGNDSSSGSSSTPWKTIDKAQSTVNPGDTVNLRPGNYGAVTFTPSDHHGTSGNYITYQNDPNESAYSAKFSRIFFSGSANYYTTVKGFDISNTGQYDSAIKTENASFVNVKDCKAHGQSGGSGPSYAVIFAKTSGNILIEDCEVYYGGGWAFAIQLEDSDSVTVRGCHVHDIVGSGIRTGGGQNYVIENNVIHDQRAEWNAEVHGSGIAIHSHNTTISGNIIYNYGNTRPIRFYQSYAGSNGYRNMIVENNLVYKTSDFTGTQWWVEFIDVGSNCVFRNNTIIDSVIMTIAPNATGSSVEIHNNIITGELAIDRRQTWANISEGGNLLGGLSSDGCGWKCIYNSFSPSSTSITGGSFSVGNLFASGSAHYPYSGDYPYQLISSARAIDIGSPSTAPLFDLLGNPRVGNPDAGCYEFSSTAPLPANSAPGQKKQY